MKVNRLPSPIPSLSARMRPPWASTIPLQMARPSPDPPSSRPRSSPSSCENLRNRWGRCSAGTPTPSSATERATWTPSRAAETRMGERSWEWRAALDSRLVSTCTTRRRSAVTRGSRAGRSMTRLLRPPPTWNRLLASSTRTVTSTGSGDTGSVPVSMRATSSRSPIRWRMLSDWSRMIRKNWVISAGSRSEAFSSRVSVEPLMAASGVLSSWLTMPRNSARSRSRSSSGVRSWMVTTTDSTSPSSDRMGVALTRAVTLRPSGAFRTISSACTVSPVISPWARGNSSRETSRPSARRKVSTSRSCSAVPSGWHRPLTIRLASRLMDTGFPVLASRTSTPTGVVFTRVSRSARARCSSRCRRALAMTRAAWEANITRVSSSSAVNSSSFSPT